MPGPVPFYGSRPDPNGRGTLVRDKNGREFLFTGPPVEGFDKYESVGGYTSPDAAAATAAVQDPRVAGTPHAAPERPRGPTFDELDRLGGEGSRPVPPQSSAAAAFARSAAAGALDTAALPVTLPARAYRAAGGRGEALDTIADLRADEALQDATWLATGEDAGPYRERVAREREEFPNASAAGTELGASLPLAALGPLSAEARALTKAERAARTAKAIEDVASMGIENTRYLKDGMRDMAQIRSAYAGATPETAEAIATGKAPAMSGKPVPPITVGVYEGDGVTLIDGRHRMKAAQEAGAQNIAAKVRVYGPKGGLISETSEVLPIGATKFDSGQIRGQTTSAARGQARERQSEYAADR